MWEFGNGRSDDSRINIVVCNLTAEEMERAVGDLGPNDWKNGIQVGEYFALVSLALL